ncbi:hypothetical protein NDU88_004819 [Pleurodeles waltl]|uniref:Uncharacterized protein n=1 Tax=Pleurodeles waltl TaxID=8319 RepID=A0AAV7SK09_PLEWA|nr:hypothetical protein NDU88_004819 [Pleurodeles waltl]
MLCYVWAGGGATRPPRCSSLAGGPPFPLAVPGGAPGHRARARSATGQEAEAPPVRPLRHSPTSPLSHWTGRLSHAVPPISTSPLAPTALAPVPPYFATGLPLAQPIAVAIVSGGRGVIKLFIQFSEPD